MEEFDHFESTQGAAKKGFVSVQPDKDEPTKTDENSESVQSREDRYGIYGIPKAVKALEEHSAFTGSIIALIGYIVIAAFGRMTNFADFERYVLFLFLVFILYRALKIRLQDFVMKKKDWILLGICVILLIILLYNNFHEVVAGLKNIVETLKESSTPPI